MELKDYGRIILQRGWIVLLATLLTAASGYLWSRAQTPEYRASARLLVRADSLDFGRLQASKQVLASFRERIRSPETAFAVVEELQLDLNPYDLLGAIAVSTDQDSLTLQIDCTLSDPEVAMLVANAFADSFEREIRSTNLIQRREDQILVEVIQEAGRGGQISPRPLINTLAGGVLGLLLGGLIVLLLELIDDTIKSKEDIERYLGKDLLLLGQVPPGQADLAAPRKEGARA